MSRYQFIGHCPKPWLVQVLYRVLGGSCAGYYQWRAQPAPTALDRVWVGDITYLLLVGGRWCYLVTWRDACSRRVVGWHLAAHMPTELVLLTLEQALTLR